uniref:Uncharacterized protein n=1 Tax=uncultured prokaryote TaxID=198431 RepID=A0A0H5QI02_9ZZZZ|nr:hypothetical protein [uncultured prokaryote]
MSISSVFEAEAMKLVVQEAHEEVASSLKAFSVRVPESTVLVMDNLARELRCSRNDVAMMILTTGCYDAAKAVTRVMSAPEDNVEFFLSLIGHTLSAVQAEVAFGAVPVELTQPTKDAE